MTSSAILGGAGRFLGRPRLLGSCCPSTAGAEGSGLVDARGKSGWSGVLTTIDNRRGAADGRRGMTDRALDLADEVDVLGLFGLGGGLHSRHLLVEAVRGGNGDGDNAGLGVLALRLTDGDRRPPARIGKMEIGLM